MSDTNKRTHCQVSATAHLIPTLTNPVHVLQGLVCEIIDHAPSFAITLNCLHIYEQASIVYHVLRHLTGT